MISYKYVAMSHKSIREEFCHMMLWLNSGNFVGFTWDSVFNINDTRNINLNNCHNRDRGKNSEYTCKYQ